MKARVTQLEAFRRWRLNEDATVQDFLAYMLASPSPRMNVGTVFHKMLESLPGLANYGLSKYTRNGITFNFKCEAAISLPQFVEVRAEKQYGAPPTKKPAETFYTKPATTKAVEHTPTENFTPSDTSNLQVGAKVEHMKFGFGQVMKMEGAAHNPIATVHFELNGEKKIMLNYAKLRIVE